MRRQPIADNSFNISLQLIQEMFPSTEISLTLYLSKPKSDCTYCTEFRLVAIDRNQIVLNIFRSTCNRLVPIQSENGKYHLVSVDLTGIKSKFARVYMITNGPERTTRSGQI